MGKLLATRVGTFIVVFHLAAIALLIAGQLWAAGAWVALGGLGAFAFAYSRGLLHALDADHLAMIDGSTRKLMGEGRDSRGIGLAFSLGHSTVVLAAGVAVVAGSQWVRGAFDDSTSTAAVLGTIGASVSGLYLLCVAAANVPHLMRALNSEPAEPDHQHSPTGLMSRLLAGPLSRVRHAGHVYLFGFLFGLGFDTASTIGVLMLTGSLGLTGASSITLMALPVAFTAAMTLGDTINATIMRRVYSTAADKRRRLNVALLVVSIASAALIGGASVINVIASFTGAAIDIDAGLIGYILLGVAVLGGLWLAITAVHDKQKQVAA